MFSANNLHLGVQLPVIEIKVENKKKKNKCSAADYESLKKTRQFKNKESVLQNIFLKKKNKNRIPCCLFFNTLTPDLNCFSIAVQILINPQVFINESNRLLIHPPASLFSNISYKLDYQPSFNGRAGRSSPLSRQSVRHFTTAAASNSCRSSLLD